MKQLLGKSQDIQYPIKIAAFTDRFLAVIFDIILFSPVFALLLSPVLQSVDKVWRTSTQSLELFVLLAVLVVYTSFLVILFQAVSYFWFGTTPGKYFLKMKVVNEEGRRLSLHQSFLRAIFWVLQFFFLGIPFLEVLSNPLRRAIHDRVSGTLVITLKEIGDLGPHPLERHFIRQILMIASVGFASWIFVFSSHFLTLAEKGDFKKAELEEAGYLCEKVTANIESKESRIEKSIALFNADEISKDCLLTEADFVFWQPVPIEKDWAYLAKAYVHKADVALFEEYLNNVCDENEEGVACQLAQFEGNTKGQAIRNALKESQSLPVVQRLTVDAFESGHYSQAEKGFVDLKEKHGLEAYALKGLVKTLWAKNELEKSRGVYLATFSQLNPEEKVELAAWSCHEQLDRSCDSSVKSSCEDLKRELSSQESTLDSYTALAMIRENECRQSYQQDWRKFHSLFQKRKDLYQFVRAISKESEVSDQERESLLEDLAFRKNEVSPQFLRRMAIMELAQSMRSPKKIDRVMNFLKERTTQDLTWVKTYQRALDRLASIGRSQDLNALIDLPKSDTEELYELSYVKIQALYKIGDFEQLEKKLAILDTQKTAVSGRQPASFGASKIASIENMKQGILEYKNKKKNPPQLKEASGTEK